MKLLLSLILIGFSTAAIAENFKIVCGNDTIIAFVTRAVGSSRLEVRGLFREGKRVKFKSAAMVWNQLHINGFGYKKLESIGFTANICGPSKFERQALWSYYSGSLDYAVRDAILSCTCTEDLRLQQR